MPMPMDTRKRALHLGGLALLAACAADADAVSGPGAVQRDDAAVRAGGKLPPDGGADASSTARPSGTDSGARAPVGLGASDGAARTSDDSDVCASVRVVANRITPEVVLVIDGSGSMAEPLGDVSRWGALRTALFGPAGVVRELEGIVRFGMTVYSTPIPMRGTPLGMCPSLLAVPPALNNLAAITAAFPQRPSGGFTPTGEALKVVADSMTAASTQETPDRGDKLIVLATDGEPNSCESLATLPLQRLLDGTVPVNYAPSEAAVRAAQAKDVDTYVVSLAPGLISNAESREHLQALANLGRGFDGTASPGAELFSPQDPAQLGTTLRGLVGSVVSCELSLEGKLVVDQACDGEVRLNGTPLSCNGAHGWAVVDDARIRLLGDACETWKNLAAAAVEATFPCEAVIPLI
jgi:Mg-chelatase subunit ChlD